MRLVVGDAARDELAVALDERPGVGLPELERVGRLHVEVGVREDGRRAVPRRRRRRARRRAAGRPAPRSRPCRPPRGSARRPTPRRRARRPLRSASALTDGIAISSASSSTSASWDGSTGAIVARRSRRPAGTVRKIRRVNDPLGAFPLPGSAAAVVAVAAPARGTGSGTAPRAPRSTPTGPSSWPTGSGWGRTRRIPPRPSSPARRTATASRRWRCSTSRSTTRCPWSAPPSSARRRPLAALHVLRDEGQQALVDRRARGRRARGVSRAEPRTVFPGSELGRRGSRRPAARRRLAGVDRCHPLDETDEEDRMFTAYATSADGLDWDWHGVVLSPERDAGTRAAPA